MTAVATIDGDILIYRIGFTTQEVPVEIACHRMDDSITKIADATEAEELKIFLTGTGHTCFRYKIDPLYKANRKNQKKPTWYSELRAHLVHDYNATVTVDLEADDALGIAQNDHTVLCSIDKDLDQIPGKHYDFVKEVFYEVSHESALRFFYLQLLTGDSTDNIPGLRNVGPVASRKILAGLTKEREYLLACIKAYRLKKHPPEYMSLMGQLLKIRRKEDEPLWDVEREMVRLGVPDWKTRLRRTSSETDSSTSTSLSTSPT